MANVQDMILEQLRTINEKLDSLFKNGCSKATHHDECNTELFRRVNQLEVSRASDGHKDKIDRALDSLQTPYPWLFASVAVFSPYLSTIIQTVKGVLQ